MFLGDVVDFNTGEVLFEAGENVPADWAETLRAMIEGLPSEVRVVSFEGGTTVDADLVVNATPLGAAGETVPHPPLRPGMLVVDLLYRPSVTPLQAAAKAAGAGDLRIIVRHMLPNCSGPIIVNATFGRSRGRSKEASSRSPSRRSSAWGC